MILDKNKNSMYHQKEFEIQQLIWMIIMCIWMYMLGLLL
jgi:hypothetical protein